MSLIGTCGTESYPFCCEGVFPPSIGGKEQSNIYVLNDFFQLLINEYVVLHLVDLMNILKNEPTNSRVSKTISYMLQDGQTDFDPQVNLHIEGSLIPKFILDFGSQVNILTKCTWEKLGWLRLIRSDYYLKLADHGPVEPLDLCKNIEIVIMGIPVMIDFKVIEPKEGSKSYPNLVSRLWERKMKVNIESS